MRLEKLSSFLDVLGLEEPPMAIFYSDTRPEKGYSPKPAPLPTLEKERKGEIDWQQVFSRFSCVLGNVWLARKKQSTAYFSAENYGCPGAAFWGGFLKPQTETIIRYVSTGTPGQTPGERYCRSPEVLRTFFEQVDPRQAPAAYCVIKPITACAPDEVPELVTFFARPESLCGLHQLAAFATDDPEAVVSPWSSGCGGMLAWPQKYLQSGRLRAVLGGWDPSARKFYRTDELTMTMPLAMFERMLAQYEDSFLLTETWRLVQKKIARSKQAWDKKAGE